jgi:hypothetical protein
VTQHKNPHKNWAALALHNHLSLRATNHLNLYLFNFNLFMFVFKLYFCVRAICPSCALNLAKRSVASRLGLVRMHIYGVALSGELEQKGRLSRVKVAHQCYKH